MFGAISFSRLLFQEHTAAAVVGPACSGLQGQVRYRAPPATRPNIPPSPPCTARISRTNMPSVRSWRSVKSLRQESKPYFCQTENAPRRIRRRPRLTEIGSPGIPNGTSA